MFSRLICRSHSRIHLYITIINIFNGYIICTIPIFIPFSLYNIYKSSLNIRILLKYLFRIGASPSIIINLQHRSININLKFCSKRICRLVISTTETRNVKFQINLLPNFVTPLSRFIRIYR